MLKLFINMKLAVARFMDEDERGEDEKGEDECQGLTEYALILAFIAIVAILALTFLGGKVSNALSTVGNSLNI
jgi:Flp pilus assembly pilin Flp